MKKIFIVALMVVLCALCLTACNVSAEGTYYFDSIVMGDLTYKAGQEIPVDLNGKKLKYEKDTYVLDLKNDGTGTLISKESGRTITTEFTWKLSEDKKNIILTADGSDEVCKFEGGKISIEFTEGVQLILKKQ